MSAGLRTILGAWWMRWQSAPVPDAPGCVTLYADKLGTVDLYADATGTATAYSQALGTVDVYAGIC